MKILIIRLSSMGDIILTQPVCAILYKQIPGCEIDFVCKPEYKELVELFVPQVNVICYAPTLAFFIKLHKVKYDIIIDLHNKLASNLIMQTVDHNKAVCYNKLRQKRLQIVKGNHKLAIESTLGLYYSALMQLGIKPPWIYPKLRTKAITELMHLRKKIAVFPGATHFTKRYPVESWISVINSCPQYDFTLFGGAGDKELNTSIKTKTTANCDDQTGLFIIPELLKELQRYDLVLSGDTGPMHLTATLGKPQIAIFGGTHPRLGFKPLNDKAVVLSANISCQPCSLHGLKKCPKGHFKCMKNISPKLLQTEINKILA